MLLLISVLGIYICSLLLINEIWKYSSIMNTSKQHIEPSIISGLCMGGIPYLLHMVFFPVQYQQLIIMIDPYLII